MKRSLLATTILAFAAPGCAPPPGPAAGAAAAAPPADSAAACPAIAGWRTGSPTGEAPIRPIVNWLGIVPGGGFSWNGMPADSATVERYLAITGRMSPRPHLRLVRLEGASCAEVAAAAAFVDRVGGCAPGGCWLADHGMPPSPAPPAPPRR